MKKHRKILIVIGLAVLFTLAAAGISMADVSVTTENNIGTGEVVFLLDTSGSMNTQDKNRDAIDAIRQAAYSLPSDYKAGLVAYNAGIQAIVPLAADMNLLDTQLSAITYKGYTNAGEGLTQAMNLFTDNAHADRSIIMITDGEIDMPKKQEKEQSRAMYQDAAEKAKEKGVKIYIVAVGNELGDPQMHIFDGAEITDGAIYWESQSGSLSQIMNKIMAERLEVPRESVGVTDANGGMVHAKIPEGVSRARLLITGESLKDVTANYTADSGRTTSGSHFAVVDMTRPAAGSADVQFKTADLSGVQASLLTEYGIEPAITVTWRAEPLPQTETEKKKQVPPVYQHFADVTIALADAGGSHGMF